MGRALPSVRSFGCAEVRAKGFRPTSDRDEAARARSSWRLRCFSGAGISLETAKSPVFQAVSIFEKKYDGKQQTTELERLTKSQNVSIH